MSLANSSLPTTDVPVLSGDSQVQCNTIRKQARRLNWLPPTLACVALGIFAYTALCAAERLHLNHGLAMARNDLRRFQPEAAIQRLTTIIARWPACAEAEFLVACAYRRAGELNEAAPHLRRATELGWDRDAIERQYCLAFFQVGDFRRAGKDLAEQLKRQVNNDDAEETYEAMVRGYTAALLLQQANYMLDGWLKWQPNCPQAYLLKANVALLAGNERGELYCYEKAVECDPANFEARRCLARAVLTTNEIEKAAQLYEACVSERQNDAESLTGLAECRQRQSRMEDAKKLLHQSLNARPDGAQKAAALALLGQIAVESKQYEEASRLFKEAVDAHPANIPALYSLAQALARAGRADEASHYQERFQELKNLDRHLEDLRGELLDDPGNADIRAEIGETMLKEGATRAGANWLLSALLYDPAHAKAHRRLAAYYDSGGNVKLAERHRQAAAAGSAPRAVSPPVSGSNVFVPLRSASTPGED